ncbi:solute carrier organic anion transporter family member 4A1-like isoform X2 [Branchiostoma floridae]|uniref:Solute carrier organic anion transporter family member n=1 Tax=Branchiostoma floridae TaxID=7739 RepID=A0A9J7M564_BRAFL|nr:solute carrier organic anion transporter family member 4A1-like isoform X2 [Branchiostoma floridae]
MIMRTNMEDEGDRRDCAGQEKDKKLRYDSYGWGSFKPATLQVLNNPKAALVFLSCAIFTQAMTVNGLARSVVTTLERRFHLTSTDMGAVLIANDVANFVSSLPISYLGAKNKPRWLGSGMLLLAVGAFVFALPHFVAEPYRVVPTTSHELCRPQAPNFSWNQTKCGNTTSSTGQGIQDYMYVLVLGKFLIGIGACALFSLGVTYINENTPSNQSSVYLGIFYSFSIVGPAVGYLLASVFLKIPTDNTFPTHIDPEHPQWIGAWWIGFILTGVLAVVAAIFILGLPRRLSSKVEDAIITVETPLKEIQRDKPTLDNKNGDADKLPSDTASPDQQNGGGLSLLHGVVEKSARIMQNRTFVFLSMATVTEKGIAAGIATFIAKYIESQFRTSAGEAAMLMGIVSIPGATIGTLLGGYLVKRFELQVRGIVKMCTVLTLMTITLMTMVSLLLFLITCEDVSMTGVNTAYHNSSHAPTSLIDGCNARCGCSRDQYQPVCGGDELVYFSPCLAGCQGLATNNGSQVYDNCTCVAGGFATSGICAVNCPLKPLFLVILFFMSLGMFITYIPLLTATLRAVTEEDGPFATGLQDAMIRGLGYIPCILLVGAVIDRACALQDSSCTNGGSCLLYVNRYFGLYLLAVCMAYKVASCLFYALVLLFDRGEAHVEYSNIK